MPGSVIRLAISGRTLERTRLRDSAGFTPDFPSPDINSFRATQSAETRSVKHSHRMREVAVRAVDGSDPPDSDPPDCEQPGSRHAGAAPTRTLEMAETSAARGGHQ